MQIGMIGLGRMGANMVRRLMDAGHTCTVYDANPAAVAELEAAGAEGTAALVNLVAALAKPRMVWVMVPAGEITERVIEELSNHLEAGDCIVDGGNSYFKDDIRRAEALQAKCIDYLDVGTSGGVWGRERGYCLMSADPRRPLPVWNRSCVTSPPARRRQRGHLAGQVPGRRPNKAISTAGRVGLGIMSR